MKQPLLLIISILPAIVCLSLIHTLPARAAICSAVSGDVALAPLTITVQRDMPNGPTGDSLSIPVAPRYTCTADATPVTDHQFGINGYYANITGNSYSGRTLYKLGTSGIGYTILGLSNSTSYCSASAYLGVGPAVGTVDNSVRLCHSTSGLISPAALEGGIQVDFFKIGTLTPGSIPSTQLGSFANQINNGSWTPPPVYINSAAITLIVKACSVTTTAITVPMGEVSRSAFTGIGSTAATRDFTIPLDCDASTNIRLQLDGTIASGQPTVLALTASASPPEATGVGIQVLYAGNPIQMGTPIAIGTTASVGPYDIPLQARYYQTGSVTAGPANSTATFTITYD